MITANLHTFAARNVRFGNYKEVIYPNYYGKRPRDRYTMDDTMAISAGINSKNHERAGDYANAIEELKLESQYTEAQDVIHESSINHNIAKNYLKLGDKKMRSDTFL